MTREIQHDILPQFLDRHDGCSRAIGEPRHRRSYLYDLAVDDSARGSSTTTPFGRSRRNTRGSPSADGSKILIVAERDGNTVSPDRGVYLMDLAATVTVEELRARVAADLKAERALRAEGPAACSRRLPTPCEPIVARASRRPRVYGYEKALFDFDSKHITKPGNKLASEYLFNTYKSFGYEPEYQWFAPRGALGGQTANVVATLKGHGQSGARLRRQQPLRLGRRGTRGRRRHVGNRGAARNGARAGGASACRRRSSSRRSPARRPGCSAAASSSGARSQDKVKIVGALNNDMIGWANDDRLDNTIRYSNPGIRDVQHGAAIEFTNLITYDALYYKSTDAAAYYEAYGDIVGGIGSYPVLGNPHYHQPHDLLDGINHQLVAEVAKTTAATLMLLASSPSRIAGLQATASANGASLSWTPAPETGITGYIVTWGPGRQSVAAHVAGHAAEGHAARRGSRHSRAGQGCERERAGRLGLGARRGWTVGVCVSVGSVDSVSSVFLSVWSSASELKVDEVQRRPRPQDEDRGERGSARQGLHHGALPDGHVLRCRCLCPAVELDPHALHPKGTE